MSNGLDHDQAVLDRLALEAAKEGSTGWVFAGELVPLVPPGKFWETMDRIKGRVSKAAIPDPETGKERTAFRWVKR